MKKVIVTLLFPSADDARNFIKELAEKTKYTFLYNEQNRKGFAEKVTVYDVPTLSEIDYLIELGRKYNKQDFEILKSV